jgi:hypothetical protein
MITTNIKINDGITPMLKGMKKQLQAYPKDAEAKFISLTPIKTGNARSNTGLVGKNTISANYAYAQRLDQGWSGQAPTGMTRPFEAWKAAKVKQIFGK